MIFSPSLIYFSLIFSAKLKVECAILEEEQNKMDAQKVLVDKSVGSDDKLPKFQVGASRSDDDIMEHTLAAMKPKCASSKATTVFNSVVTLKRVLANNNLSQLGEKSEDKVLLIDYANSDEK